jgi:hypothetical protein
MRAADIAGFTLLHAPRSKRPLSGGNDNAIYRHNITWTRLPAKTNLSLKKTKCAVSLRRGICFPGKCLGAFVRVGYCEKKIIFVFLLERSVCLLCVGIINHAHLGVQLAQTIKWGQRIKCYVSQVIDRNYIFLQTLFI